VLALVHGRQRLGTKTVGPDLLLLERVWEERRTRRFAAFRTGDRRTGCSLFSSNQCAGLGHNRSEALRWR